MMQQIYLDNNSTTILDPTVKQAMVDCYNEDFMNPASQHRFGQTARRRLEKLRAEIIEMLGGTRLGMEADRLIFTSGGTESNNLALIGLAHEPDGTQPESPRVLISSIEHPSVVGAAEYLKQQGFDIEQIPVNDEGVIQLEAFRSLIQKPTRLVSVMTANNETGVVQPIEKIVDLCREKQIIVHTDAVQAVGKIPLSFVDLGVDALSFTAHKLHGPRGIGGLLVKHNINPAPIVFGGFQQMAIRPGTEDVALVTGAHQALKVCSEDRWQHMKILRDLLQEKIRDSIPDMVINGGDSERTPHTLNVSFPGINRQELLMAADVSGLAISTGSACASGSSEPSPVLMAMGLESAVIEGSVRISLSAFTTKDEINLASDRIISLVNSLRR